MAEFVSVAKASDLKPGEMKRVELEGQRILLANVGGSFCAVGESCTHRGGPLSEGELEGEIVTCPWHGGQFNVKTGEVVQFPPVDSIPSYQVRVQGQDVQIARP